ncbi:MAG TPA: hypothetical protein VG675_18030 [Bryobacteraceae bacterium]|nr:hypothetical protein [Bryobacteraceae bacterium]
MDLKLYYQKIRETESKLRDADPVVVSLATPDGGKAGVLTEAPRAVAAKLVVDGCARLADPEEAKQFRAEREEAKRVADQIEASSKVQLAVLSTAELDRLKNNSRGTKN